MDADCTIVDPDGVTLPAGCEAWSVLAELDTGSGSQAHNQPLSITSWQGVVDYGPSFPPQFRTRITTCYRNRVDAGPCFVPG